MKDSRSRPTPHFTSARVFRVSLSVSSTLLGLRSEAASPKTPFRVGGPELRGWLSDGDAAPAALAVTPDRGRRELFFIDAAVADPGAFWLVAPRGGTVVCIPAGVDSWRFMAQEAEQFRGLRAIHIISHGQPGGLVLNGRYYAAGDLESRSPLLHQLGRALTKNGDILLYGCNTGEGAEGAKLVATLAAFTGADVAASSNPTGGVAGDDWTLEVTRGGVETTAVAPAAYEHELGTLTVTTNADSGGGSLRQAIADANPGDTITFNAGMTVMLTSGQFAIAKDLTIDGDLNDDGSPDVTLDAGYNSRVLSITAGVVQLDGLAIIHGLVSGNGGNGPNSPGQPGMPGGSAFGAGLSVTGGKVTIAHSSIAQNVAAGGGGGSSYGYAGTSRGGGGGGGFAGQGGGNGGRDQLSGYAGGSGSGGNGGNGNSHNPAMGLGGNGGTSAGGAGGAAAGSSGYIGGAGGAGGTASVGGFGAVGGGGGAAGNSRLSTPVGGIGGAAAGGMFVGPGATVLLSTTAIRENLGAGGGGSGGNNPTAGLDGGDGTGGILVQGLLKYELATVSFAGGNSGVGGGGGAGGPTKAVGANGASTNDISDDHGVGTVQNFLANGDPEGSGLPNSVTVATGALTDFDLSGLALTDADAGAGALTVTLSAGAGTLTASNGGGITVVGSGTDTLAVTGNLASLNTFFDSTSSVRYTGGAADTVEVTVNDHGNTGTGGGGDVALGTVSVATVPNNAPTIGGAVAGQAVNDSATTAPFAALTLADPDAGSAITASIALDDGAKGVFTPASLVASGFSSVDGGTTYSHPAASPAQMQAAIRQLVFDPTDNRVVVGANETTAFAVTVDDGAGPVADNVTTVVSTSIIDAPSVTSAATTENTQTTSGLVISRSVSDGGEVTHFKITAITGGTLFKNDGTTPIADGEFVTFAEGNAGLRFTPASGANDNSGGPFSFTVQSSTDNTGSTLSAGSATATVSVASVNSAPAGADKAVNLTEGDSYTFATADFGFTDPNDAQPNFLQAVKITSVPTAGSLTNYGTPVQAGDVVPWFQIEFDQSLVFKPAALGNGLPYATFEFQVQDDGGTDGSGIDLDPTPNTITLNVASLNAPPAGTDNTITLAEGGMHVFTAGDFGLTDPNDASANALLAVKITTLPGAGTLTNNNVAVKAGDFVTAAAIAANQLVFTPAAFANGDGYATFTFQVEDDGGGDDLDASPNTITLDVTPVNDAPTDIALTVATVNQSGGVNATVGTLSATDVDDTEFTFELATGDGTNDAGNDSFNISGTTLRANDAGLLAPGPYAVHIQADDGHSGTVVKDFTVTVLDDVAPTETSTPVLTIGSDTGASNSDGITADTTPTFTGTAEAGTTVKLYDTDGTTVLGTATTAGGIWTITTSVLGAGTHKITAVATDAQGNPSGASPSFEITVLTAAPTLEGIVRRTPATLNAGVTSVTWRVTFGGDVNGVDASDFLLSAIGGIATGTIASVTPVSGAVYDVTVDSISGLGGLQLDLKATGTGITDLAGNPIVGGEFTNGDFYIVGASSTFDTIGLSGGTPSTVTVSRTSGDRVAQRFTTSGSAPLSLTTVSVQFGSKTGTPIPVVTLHADDGGAIDPTIIATLASAGSFQADAVNVWSSSQLLETNTTYWIVFEDSSVNGSYNIDTTGDAANGAGDWLTGADQLYRYGAGASNTKSGNTLQMAVGATSTPVISSALTGSGTYGTAFDGYTIEATNGATRYDATGLPTGLSLDAGTGVISGTPKQSGTFNVSLTATNGSGTGPASTLVLTVAKASLTVTAQGATRAYGQRNPALGVAYSGFASGDNESSLTTAPTATTSADADSAVGTYTITPDGGVSPDYTFSYVPGTLTVTRASQSITFAPIADSRLGQTVTLSATATAGLPITFTVVSGRASITEDTVSFSGVGVVTVRASQGGDGNHLPAAPVERRFLVAAGPAVDVSTSSDVPVPELGGTVELSVPASPGVAYQWQRNGTDLAGATSPGLTLTDVEPPAAGLYTYTASTSGGTGTSEPVIVGLATTEKVVGTGEVVDANAPTPSGVACDQMLLEGTAATMTADPAKVTRIGFVDLSGDIVRVEFSGAGSLSVVMDDASAPAPAADYNQPDVNYVQGHVGIVITGANETSNLSVVSIGRITAVNQSLFRSDVDYDATADIAFVAIQSANGKFGGLRTGNVSYVAITGFAGVYAPGVQFTGPVNIGNIRASDRATPLLVLGSAPEVRITGGDLLQPNHQPITVQGLSHLQFTDGTTSQGELLPAQRNAGVLLEDGIDVTDLLVAEP